MIMYEFHDELTIGELRSEMEMGYVIQDAKGKAGYDVYHYHKHLFYSDSWDQVIREIVKERNRVGFWPNVFYVNERGNTDLLVIKKQGRGFRSEIIQSWV